MTASARSSPAEIRRSVSLLASTIPASTFLPRSAVRAGATPSNGTGLIGTLYSRCRRSISMCADTVAPAVAISTSPGLARAASKRSLALWYREPVGTTTTFGPRYVTPMGWNLSIV